MGPQLVRVRERLGNLCQWKSSASEAAIMLARSIERFMHDFFPDSSNPGNFDTFSWNTQTERKLSDTLSVDRDKKNKAKWLTRSGKIEAVLSLWIASLAEAGVVSKATPSAESGSDTKAGDEDERSNWRRTKAGIESKLEFGRIVGENFEDGVLHRDISWWTGNTAEAIKTEHQSRDKTKFVIGFTGPLVDKRRKEKREELSVVSSGYLPTILAQRLFTSFIWAISERLNRECLRGDKSLGAAKVNAGTFTLDTFKETWHSIKITHPRLEGFVDYAISAGLGTRNDILFCVVPAFSSRDLLPNDAILSLMPNDPPRIQQHGWARTASFYRSLLESNIGTTVEEYFALAVVVDTMDFIYLAFEPYGDNIPPDSELKDELVYECQRRSKTFQAIFRHCGPTTRNNGQRDLKVDTSPTDRTNYDDNDTDEDEDEANTYRTGAITSPTTASHNRQLQDFCNWNPNSEAKGSTHGKGEDPDKFFRRIGFTKDHQAACNTLDKDVSKEITGNGKPLPALLKVILVTYPPCLVNSGTGALKKILKKVKSERLPISKYVEEVDCGVHSESHTGILEYAVQGHNGSFTTCLRTKIAIPPNLDSFYFEVHILEKPREDFFCVGFSQRPVTGDEYLGYDHQGSFAYYCDDGRLWAHSLEVDEQTSSFKFEESYGQGSIVGCGLDMKTGRGYRTLGGTRISCGDVFDTHKFDKGKIYPIIYFKYRGSGPVRFRVVLKESEQHPFVFRGSHSEGHERAAK
ncbi:hypothetical protein OQA88_4335 [Cercophora sp. LCS_1]